MGLRHISSSSINRCNCKPQIIYVKSPPSQQLKQKSKLPNPDPLKYRIRNFQQIGDYLVVLIRYPDCTNFEGNKILVFKGITLKELKKQGQIDPHFFFDPEFVSPIARFIPTKEGWEMALCFAQHMDVNNI